MSMDASPPPDEQPPSDTPDPGGNPIVPNPPEGGQFPTLALAAVIVGAGVFLTAQYSARAAWLLAFIIMLGIALRYPTFADELTKLLGGSVSNQQTNATDAVAQATETVQTYVDQLSVPTIRFGN